MSKLMTEMDIEDYIANFPPLGSEEAQKQIDEMVALFSRIEEFVKKLPYPEKLKVGRFLALQTASFSEGLAAYVANCFEREKKKNTAGKKPAK